MNLLLTPLLFIALFFLQRHKLFSFRKQLMRLESYEVLFATIIDVDNDVKSRSWYQEVLSFRYREGPDTSEQKIMESGQSQRLGGKYYEDFWDHHWSIGCKKWKMGPDGLNHAAGCFDQVNSFGKRSWQVPKMAYPLNPQKTGQYPTMQAGDIQWKMGQPW